MAMPAQNNAARRRRYSADPRLWPAQGCSRLREMDSMINTFAFVRRLVRNFHPENYGRAGGKPRLYAQTLYRGKTHLLRIVLNEKGGTPTVKEQPDLWRHAIVDARVNTRGGVVTNGAVQA